LHGYSQGERTIFLNADNGSAIFGKRGPGQIILDPSSNEALLYSSSFWKSYKENGLPNTTYVYSNKKYNNQNDWGMLIDLTAPRIVYGNGKFLIDNDGKLSAEGVYLKGEIHATSGAIGDWKIGDGLENSEGNVYLTPTEFKFKDNFKVDANGNLFANNADLTGRVVATSGYIGGWLVHGEYNPRYDAWSGSISSGPVSLSAGVSDSSGGIYGSISAPRIEIVEDDFSYIPNADCLGMFEGNNKENVLGIFSEDHSIVLETNRSGTKNIRLTSGGRRCIYWGSKRSGSSK